MPMMTAYRMVDWQRPEYMAFAVLVESTACWSPISGASSAKLKPQHPTSKDLLVKMSATSALMS